MNGPEGARSKYWSQRNPEKSVSRRRRRRRRAPTSRNTASQTLEQAPKEPAGALRVCARRRRASGQRRRLWPHSAFACICLYVCLLRPGVFDTLKLLGSKLVCRCILMTRCRFFHSEVAYFKPKAGSDRKTVQNWLYSALTRGHLSESTSKCYQ